MKYLSLFAIVFAFAMTSCNSDTASTADTNLATPNAPTAAVATPNTPVAPAVPVGPTTTVEFAENTYDFGEVMDGEKVEHTYSFTNTGSEPLVISNAKGSCGCTVPSWPKEPIAPGETGEILVRFDSKGKGRVGGGAQTKTVTITANTTPPDTRITIKGKVNKEETAG
ncbi:DUF1573 domain-containing protein [Portibacter lacus]|uniref:DUF1573 domain-containing protein n=1 Tax=Portibacter lacus TaxID=1099794 RepID=A0AA37SPY4_9BACT|nr:DUF1573 domain-containing protein [Portibacter lacus]GLR17362.1 hypothetical protein GCM10007940_19770 [Portibacter lacus]